MYKILEAPANSYNWFFICLRAIKKIF